MKVPSIETLATPVANRLSRSQRSAVPLNVNVARPPEVTVCLAVSPLKRLDTPDATQSDVKTTAGSVSWARATAGAGLGTASKASTTTHADEAAGFIVPVMSILNMWLPAEMPLAVNTVT